MPPWVPAHKEKYEEDSPPGCGLDIGLWFGRRIGQTVHVMLEEAAANSQGLNTK